MIKKICTIVNSLIITICVIGTMFLTSANIVQEYTLPKVYCFILCSLLLFLFYLLGNQKEIKCDKFLVSLSVFIGYLLLHLFFYPVRYLNAVVWISFFFLYVWFREQDQIKPSFISTGIIVVCFFQALYGMAQYSGLVPSYFSFPITGRFDNPAGFSACLAIGFPFIFQMPNKNRFQKAIAIVVGIILVSAIALSGSRAGIIAVFLVLMIRLYLFVIKRNLQLRKFLPGFLIVGSCLFLVYLVSVKKDSASGRLLIWQVTWNMIKDHPVTGAGNGSFMADYMLYQAEYFEQHPDSPYGMLADNVLHPFNEYLLLVAEYGLVGFLLLLYCIFYLLKKNRNSFFSVYNLCLISLAVFSLFSYPLRYPFVWFVSAFCLAQLTKNNPSVFSLTGHKMYIRLVGLMVVMAGIFVVIQDFRFEHNWKKVIRLSSLGKNDSKADYRKLYTAWNKNPLFLYNYGAEMNYIKEYAESNFILHQCESYWNDYDVKLLQADNYFYTKEWDMAEAYYKKALLMCPNRFVPLRGLISVYDSTGRKEDVLKVIQVVLEKPVKIESPFVNRMKVDAKRRYDKLLHEMK